MSEANAHRGEVSLKLDGEDFVLRPSYEAIVAFEAATGRGLLALARSALAGELTLDTTAAIATECIRAWGRETNNFAAKASNPSRIASLIIESEDGFADVLGTIAGMLSLAATGGYNASGEARAPAVAKKKTPAGA